MSVYGVPHGAEISGTDIGIGTIGIGTTTNCGGIAERHIINVGIYWLAPIAGGDCHELSPTALRILFKMALSVLDEDDMETGHIAGVYWAGWKSLTYVLGEGQYDRNDSLPPYLERRIARGIAELRDAGYLLEVPREIAKRHPGRRVYGLNTDRTVHIPRQ